ncbi:hypothetical protein NMG60_11030342 [Bertholletia excelsa]
MACSKTSVLVMAVVAVALTAATLTEGATPPPPTPSCAAKLVPCVDYINSTNPPASCCDPLREAVNTEMDCLCSLFNTPGLLAQFRINVTDALLLPSRCKITDSLNPCVNASAPSSSPPPATPGNDNNGVGRIAWTGIPGIILFWASLKLLQ